MSLLPWLPSAPRGRVITANHAAIAVKAEIVKTILCVEQEVSFSY